MKNTLYAYFHNQALARPNALAVIDVQRQLTYAELEAMVDSLASQMPVAEPRRVGIVMDHGIEMIASILAVLKRGAGYVPAEPSFPRNRIEFIMNECNVDFVITQQPYIEKTLSQRHMIVAPGYESASATPVEDLSYDEGLAYVLYTSGSTGLPKGVMVSNQNVCHYVRAFQHEFNPGKADRVLQYSVCTFDIFVEEVFSALLSGAALVIPDKESRSDIKKLMKYVAQHSVTIISGFPYLLLELNKLRSLPSCVRLLISGGDVLRQRYISRLLPAVEIYNTYGPSEATVCCAYQRCNDVEPLADGTYPIGKPVMGSQILILNDELQPVADGQVGEICILGDGVSMGYIGDRAEENEAFVDMGHGRRLYRSGDMGYRQADGSLCFLHRKDQQVMILGRRVETCEVQNVLCQCPQVESGVVKASVDNAGLAFLIAYFVPKIAKHFSLASLKRSMSRFLPEYMIPEFFVTMQAIPLTLNGKVDDKELPKIDKINTL